MGTDSKDEVKKEKTLFQPIIATGMKITDEGKPIGKKELYKFEIPIEEDNKILKNSVTQHTIRARSPDIIEKINNTNVIKDDNVIKDNNVIKNDNIDNIDKHNEIKEIKEIEKYKGGKNIMEAKDVKAIFDEQMKGDKINETISDIKKMSENLIKQSSSMENNLDKKVDNLESSLIEKFTKQMDSITEKMEKQTNSVTEKMEKNEQDLTSKQNESCTGIDCIKKSISEIKDSNTVFESMIKKLDDKSKTALCIGDDGCNSKIPVGSSFCPGCGKKINGWKGMPDWVSYDKRK